LRSTSYEGITGSFSPYALLYLIQIIPNKGIALKCHLFTGPAIPLAETQ